jgi:hypothetical protein
MKTFTEQILAEQEAKGTSATGAKFYTPLAIGVILLQFSSGSAFSLDRQKMAAEGVHNLVRHEEDTQQSTEISVALYIYSLK